MGIPLSVSDQATIAEDFVLNTGVHVFLTGKAGTGKTTLLRKIADQGTKNMVIVAPTGVAAINARGMTIHSFFQLPSTTFVPSLNGLVIDGIMDWGMLAKQHRIRKEKRSLLMELELLVIDEISMVRADLLDAIDFTLRRLRKKEEPFGGVQLLVIGDLFQLSPVVRRETWTYLRPHYQSPFFFDSMVWQRCQSVCIELDKVYRQEDDTFVSILNNIRIGKYVETDISTINECYKDGTPNSEVITLTTHNNKADTINTEELEALSSQPIKLSAEVSGKFNENSYPLPEQIVVKKGARVMFVRNHPDGIYFNGKIGEVTGRFEESIFVKCDGDPEPILVAASEWKNNRYVLDEDTKEVKVEEIGSYKQYPLRLAWAVTVHKSQGLTFDAVNLDLKDTFAPGQLYVALSRCRSIEGLTLTSLIKQENIKVDHQVAGFYKNISAQVNTQELLAIQKKVCARSRVLEYFSFNKLIVKCEAWMTYLRESDSPDKNSFLKIGQSIKTLLEDLDKTGLRFSQQLNSLFSNEEDVTNKELLFDRLAKGIVYYTDQLHDQAVVPIEEKYEEYKKVKSSVLIKNMMSLNHDLWYRIEELYNMRYLDQPAFAAKPKHVKKIMFDPNKKAPTRVKGATYDLTYELFKAGQTLDQIAKKRSLAFSTIESHMGKLLRDEKVTIQELIPQKRMDKLYPHFIEHHKLELTELKNKIPFYSSYSELRWLQIWYQKSGADKVE